MIRRAMLLKHKTQNRPYYYNYNLCFHKYKEDIVIINLKFAYINCESIILPFITQRLNKWVCNIITYRINRWTNSLPFLYKINVFNKYTVNIQN